VKENFSIDMSAIPALKRRASTMTTMKINIMGEYKTI